MRKLGLDRFSGLYLLAIFIVVFSILAPSTFPTIESVHIVASTQSVSALVALALMIPLVCNQFDVSVGATANLAGIVCISMQTNGWLGTLPAVILSVLIGSLIGVVNGFVVVNLRVNSFIGTLATTSIVGSTLLLVAGGSVLPQIETGTYTAMAQTTVLGFQVIIVYLFALALILWWVLERTPVGRYMYASGSNPEAARLTGIDVDLWTRLSFIASGSIAAFAGVLFVSLVGPSLDFGGGLLLPSFAAVFLGMTQIRPGRANVWGTLVAILVLAVMAQGLQLTTGAVWVSGMFNGLALIAAVALAVSRERSIAAGKRAAQAKAPPPRSPADVIPHEADHEVAP